MRYQQSVGINVECNVGILKKKKRAKKYIKEHHFMFVEAPFQKVAEDVLQWGVSEWWPKDLCVQYKGVEGESLKSGTACKLIIKSKLIKTVLKGEVIRLRENKALHIEWRSGLIKGHEFIMVEERSNGTRIDYRSRYVGSNFLTQLIWVIFFRKQYNEGIRQALDILRDKATKYDEDVDV